MTERLRIFVACAPGLEPLLAEELRGLGVDDPAAVVGGVSCFGDLADVYRINLGCALGLRVLVRISEFVVRDFARLERVTRSLAWAPWLPSGRPVWIKAHSKRSRLYHTKAIVERVERSISRACGRGWTFTQAASDQAIRVQVRIIRDRCTISVDTSGARLHKRGWRQAVAKAPLREDLARALIELSGWTPQMALVDPMMGSGTIPIEAATIARGWASGRRREFACERAPNFDEGLFADARERLAQRRGPADPKDGCASVLGRDRDEGAVQSATQNAERAGVDGLRLECRALGDLELPELRGRGAALVCNPPWGLRVGDPGRLRNLYATLGKLAQRLPRPTPIGLITTEASLAHATGLPLKRALVTDQGGAKVGLWVGRLEA